MVELRALSAAARLVEALEANRGHRQLTDTVIAWMNSEVEDRDIEIWSLRAAMFASNPALTLSATPQMRDVERISLQLMADELGSPERDPGVSLALGAMSGVMSQLVLISASEDLEGVISLAEPVFNGIIESVKKDAAKPKDPTE